MRWPGSWPARGVATGTVQEYTRYGRSYDDQDLKDRIHGLAGLLRDIRCGCESLFGFKLESVRHSAFDAALESPSCDHNSLSLVPRQREGSSNTLPCN